jgi:mannitol/fructose-specific phosphotransferase system IIA component (Ntr-type)
MRLTDILQLEAIRVPLGASDKIAAITELVDLLHESDHFADRDEVLRVVLDREATRSTGIGYGLAVPHGKTRACPRLAMAVGKPAQPLDFESADRQPVTIVVLLVSPPDKTGPHIQALAKISRLMLLDDFRQAVNAAQTAEEVLGTFQRFEQ